MHSNSLAGPAYSTLGSHIWGTRLSHPVTQCLRLRNVPLHHLLLELGDVTRVPSVYLLISRVIKPGHHLSIVRSRRISSLSEKETARYSCVPRTAYSPQERCNGTFLYRLRASGIELAQYNIRPLD